MNDVASDNSRAVSRWMLVVFVVPFVVYGQTLSFDYVNYDDNIYVYENPKVMKGLSVEGVRWAFSAPRYGNYDPVTSLSHMVAVECFGRQAGPHHGTNVLLHAFNSVLLFLLLRGWTGRVSMSAVVALLFAVHPLHVESVAWISGRKDVLSTFFMLVALGIYTQYTRQPSRGRYAMLMIAFALGLLSKPMLVTFPILLLLLDYWPLGRVRIHRETKSRFATARILIVEKLPLIAMSACACAVTLFGQESAGIMRDDTTFPLMVRAANAAISYNTYLVQSLWPAWLAPFYPHQGAMLPMWQGAVAAAILVALSLVAYGLRKKYPYVLFGWVWYLVTLLPVIGLIQIGLQARADRYTYIPLIGVFVIVVWGAPEIGARLKLNRKAVAGLGATSIALFALMAYVQASHWRNSETLWSYTVKVAPENALAYRNLGVHYLRVGDIAQAEAALQQAVAWSDEQEVLRVVVGGPSLNSLGGLASMRSNFVEAGEYYGRAVELLPGNAEIRSNYGEALLASGRPNDAEIELRHAVELDSQLASAWNSLALGLAVNGKPDEALDAGAHAVALQPGNAEFRYHLAFAEFTAERYDRALKHLEKVFAIDEDFEAALAMKTEILARRGIDASIIDDSTIP